jgi:hypothetical protein
MVLGKSSWIKEDFKSKILIFLKLIRGFFWLIACHIGDDSGCGCSCGETGSDNDSMIILLS